ncbi:hypothetical protein WMY93_011217 [Mugilogobius chulae]|uniref:Uncharacterized protein n=1 Tax=Mugilogobius chulae TaxID=88201 RepID=A0AAW0P7S5_9GOBI
MAGKRERTPKTLPPLSSQGTQTSLCDESLSYAEDGEWPEAGSASSTPEAKKGRVEPSLYIILQEIRACRKDMNDCKEDLAKKIDENKATIKELITNSEFYYKELQETQTRVTTVEKNTLQHEKKIAYLEEKSNENERYMRRWNLRLYGLPEEEGENVKKRMTDICCTVAPDAGETLHLFIDICHRLGRKQDNMTRPVIIRFVSRTMRDHIWRRSKDAEILKTRKLRFKEDLTSTDKAIRSLLWPKIEEARKQGKRAFFVGPKGYIDGKEIRMNTESGPSPQQGVGPIGSATMMPGRSPGIIVVNALADHDGWAKPSHHDQPLPRPLRELQNEPMPKAWDVYTYFC